VARSTGGAPQTDRVTRRGKVDTLRSNIRRLRGRMAPCIMIGEKAAALVAEAS
jgi:hypothetical protein